MIVIYFLSLYTLSLRQLLLKVVHRLIIRYKILKLNGTSLNPSLVRREILKENFPFSLKTESIVSPVLSKERKSVKWWERLKALKMFRYRSTWRTHSQQSYLIFSNSQNLFSAILHNSLILSTLLWHSSPFSVITLKFFAFFFFYEYNRGNR